MKTIEIMPPELRLKKVVKCVVSDPALGYDLTLDCGHTVWSPIQYDEGQKPYCGRCVDLYHQKVLHK